MEEYKGCFYKSIDELTTSMTSTNSMEFPHICIYVPEEGSDKYIPVATKYTTEDVASSKYPEIFLNELCKESINDYLDLKK